VAFGSRHFDWRRSRNGEISFLVLSTSFASLTPVEMTRVGASLTPVEMTGVVEMTVSQK
jgi:hypothetical protein